MQKVGLEPKRYCYHRHLKPARLPIPPLLRMLIVNGVTECGRWDLNPHDIAITRSLVLLVCQFRHFRIAVTLS